MTSLKRTVWKVRTAAMPSRARPPRGRSPSPRRADLRGQRADNDEDDEAGLLRRGLRGGSRVRARWELGASEAFSRRDGSPSTRSSRRRSRGGRRNGPDGTAGSRRQKTSSSRPANTASCHPSGARRQAAVWRDLQRDLEGCGLPLHRVHDLRHTFIWLCVDAGIAGEVAQRWTHVPTGTSARHLYLAPSWERQCTEMLLGEGTGT